MQFVKEPPKATSLKKVKYLIRIRKQLFEVGMILTLGHYNNASLFVGLIKQGSMEETHLGFDFILSPSVLKEYSEPVSKRTGIKAGLTDVFKVYDVKDEYRSVFKQVASKKESNFV